MSPEQFLAAAGRRLRAIRAAENAWRWAWAGGLVAVIVVFAARHISWRPTEVAGFILGLGVVIGAAVVAAARRLPAIETARTADQHLGDHDALSAWVEFRQADTPFAPAVDRRAQETTHRHTVKESIGGPQGQWWRLAVAVALFGGALVMTAPSNPQDAIRRQAEIEEQAREDIADELAEAAAALPEDSDARAELEALIEQLEAGELTTEEAIDELRRIEAELNSLAGSDLASAEAAANGLDKAVGARPLPGAEEAEGAAEQLDAAAQALEDATEAERQELADRLDDLAATQRAGAPDVADALERAADAVRGGGGQQELSDAAAATRSRDAELDNRRAARDGAAAARDGREALQRAAEGAGSSEAGQPGAGTGNSPSDGDGDGQGAGEGGGDGEGDGEGQGNRSGDGDGDGQGQGSGSGTGQGAGGNPQGTVDGGQRPGGGAGTGGVGQPGDGGTHDGLAEGDPNFEEQFAPQPSGDITGGRQQGSGGDLEHNVGGVDTASDQGSARQPLADAIRQYQDQSATAIEDLAVPSTYEQLVADYFDDLARRTGG